MKEKVIVFANEMHLNTRQVILSKTVKGLNRGVISKG